jgi:hypothetical protein
MSNPSEEHWVALERLCGYIGGKEEHSLYFCKPHKMKVVCYADADYAKNVDNRRSVSGHIYTLGGMLVGWMSKTQASVTLSSTESEYVSLSMCAQEVLFIQQLLDEIFHCEKPGLIYEDNTGAIFLIKNAQVGMRTKHIDVRHHFLRDLWRKGELTVEYIRSDENVSDVMTKNVTEAIFAKLVPSLLHGKLGCWREDVGNHVE